VEIASELLDDVVAHAREEAPNECCGIVALRDGAAQAVHRFENTAASPFRFEIDGLALSHLLDELEAGGQHYAIYHSHTRSEPYPSQTDVNFARHWPGVEWLIVGLAGGEAEVRNFRIDSGEIIEAPVE
jgi:[CysO sulfur-carrier protein]-S-L-cysteine hydrolase